MRVASRELSDVEKEVAARGWTADLVARALAATRIPAAVALGRPINQYEAKGVEAGDGRLMGARGLRRTPTIVSGAGTTQDLTRAIERLPMTAPPSERQILEDLQAPLAIFTGVLYAREAPLDRTALDQALERASSGTRRLRSARMWPMSLLRRRSTPSLLTQRHA